MLKTLGIVGLTLEPLTDTEVRADKKGQELAKLTFEGRQSCGYPRSIVTQA